jgi:hypothetical protein
MRKLALGVAAAVVMFTAVPAMAQVGVYVAPGVGVQFGAPSNYAPYDPSYYAPYDGYYNYYQGPAPGSVVVVPGNPGWRGHAQFHGHGHGHR